MDNDDEYGDIANILDMYDCDEEKEPSTLRIFDLIDSLINNPVDFEEDLPDDGMESGGISSTQHPDSTDEQKGKGKGAIISISGV